MTEIAEAERTSPPVHVIHGAHVVNGWLLAAAGVLVLLAANAAVAIDTGAITNFVNNTLFFGAIYLAAVWLVLNQPAGRNDLLMILFAAAVLRGLALTPAPELSTDAYRYVWDGRVQAAGISPYLHPPADPRLERLRDSKIYPQINQKDRAVTIYPPAAELLFRAANALSDDLTGIRIVMCTLDLACIVGLLLLLKALRLPLERILIYAWHPLPIWEFAAQSHIDAAVATAIVFGLLAAVHRRQSLTGAAFAIAALTKYFPVVLLPALWRRWDWRLPSAFLLTAALLYAPYLAEAGWKVLGFLDQHLDAEGYRAGWGFHAVWLLRDFKLADPSGKLYIAIAAATISALCLYALLRRPADKIRFDHLLLLCAAFVFFASPHYPWYFAFLVPLLVLTPHPAALAMTLLSVMLYLPRPPGGLTWTGIYLAVYWLPVAIWIGTALWHATRTRMPSSQPHARDAS